MSNKELPAEVQEKIEEAGSQYAVDRWASIENKKGLQLKTSMRYGYIAGATAWAIKLVECDKANSALEEKIRGLEEQLKAQSGAWFNATDRLPLHKAFWNIEDGFKKDCSFPVRIDGKIYGMADLYDNREEGAIDPIYYFVIKGDGKEYYNDSFHRFEWLDESATDWKDTHDEEREQRVHLEKENGILTAKIKHFELFEVNIKAGLPENEASFQSGFTSGHDVADEKWKAKFRQLEADHHELRCHFESLEKHLISENQKLVDIHIENATLKEKADRMEAALKIVQQWQLPSTGKFWDVEETQPMSYGACYGSNGERDFMKAIANAALAWKEEKEGGNGY